MIKYFACRSLGMLPVLFFVALLAYAIVAIYPGDFYTAYKLRLATTPARFTRADIDDEMSHLRALRGLDKPWIVQFWYWFEGVIAHGDFGYSFQENAPVNDIIFRPQSGLAWTLVIMLSSVAWAWVVGIPAAILSAVRYRKLTDYALLTLSYGIASSPPQLLGVLFIFFVYKFVDPLIVAGGVWGLVGYQYWNEPSSLAKTLSTVWHLVPVWIIVGAPVFAAVVQHLRVSLLETFSLPYLQTAYGKGLSQLTAVLRHALRNALNPLISLSGYMIALTITGSLLAAHFLGLPSFGQTFIDALQRQDQPVVTAILLLYGILLVAGTFLSDIILLMTDPRIRYF